MIVNHLVGPGTCESPFAGHRRSGNVGFLLAMLILAFPACRPSPGEELQVTHSALATPMFVQVASSVPQIPRSFVPVTYTEAQTAGDLNVIIVGWNDTTSSVTSVMDWMGNTYQLAVGPTRSTDGISQSIYYAKKIAAAAAGSNAVSVQLDSLAVFPDIRILEYSGIDQTSPLDAFTGSSGDSTISSSGSLTTTRATDLLVAGNIVQTGTDPAGTGAFTDRVITDPDGDVAEDNVVTSPGTYSASTNLSASGQWVMQMAAFRAADVSPPTAPASLSATVVASTEIDLSWSSVTDDVNVNSYRVERCQGAGCSSFVQVASSTVTTFASTALAPNTSYSFRVRAADGAGNPGAYSPVASATTSGGCTSNSQCGTGFCVSGVCCNSACNDGCGACNAAGHVGTCTAVASGTVCRAANGPCDPADTCNGTSLACPTNSPLPEGAACSDGSACTVGDHCSAGVCQPGANVSCPSDFCHSAGTCDPATGFCVGGGATHEDSDCDDGNSCTLHAQCKAGVCVPEDPATGCTDPYGPYYAPLTNLGSTQGASYAWDINEGGEVIGADARVGFLNIYTGPGPVAGFHWTADNGMTQIPQPEGKAVFPRGINVHGVITGTAVDTASAMWKSFRFDPSTDSQVQILPISTADATGINDNGQITGYGYFGATAKMYRTSGNAVESIPGPDGLMYSQPAAIDENGTLLGYTIWDSGHTSTAIRYSDANGIEFLSQLLPSGSDWSLDPVVGDDYLANGLGTNGTQIVGKRSYTGNGLLRVASS